MFSQEARLRRSLKRSSSLRTKTDRLLWASVLQLRIVENAGVVQGELITAHRSVKGGAVTQGDRAIRRHHAAVDRIAATDRKTAGGDPQGKPRRIRGRTR